MSTPANTLVQVFAPDGTLGDIPYDKLHDALQAGATIARRAQSPDGTVGFVPASRANDVVAAGGKMLPSDIGQPSEKKGALGALGEEASGLLHSSNIVKAYEHAKQGGFEGTLRALSDLAFAPGMNPLEQYEHVASTAAGAKQRSAEGRSKAYQALADTAQATGVVDPTAMEQSAREGDPNAVIAHAAVPATMAAIGYGTSLIPGDTGSMLAARAGKILRDPATGRVMTPYELAVDKFAPDPYAPTATPAKTIPKGTNYGQYLIDQKLAAKQATAAAKAQAKVESSALVKPASAVPEPEGRPATWTNEKVMSMAASGDPRAIQQARLRALDLPPNANLVANRSAQMVPSTGNVKAKVVFDANGNPIPAETPSEEPWWEEAIRTSAMKPTTPGGPAAFAKSQIPEYIYRAHDEGDYGVNLGKHAHATSTPEAALEYTAGRPPNTPGAKQVVSKIATAGFAPGEIIANPGPRGQTWYQFARQPLPAEYTPWEAAGED